MEQPFALADGIQRVVGKARIDFPQGGEMRFDVFQLAHSASGEGRNGWDDEAFSWQPFNDLHFKLSQRNNRVHCTDLTLVNANGVVRADGYADIADRELDWQLRVDPAGERDGIAGDGVSTEYLFIKGPWKLPSIRLGPKPAGDSGNAVGWRDEHVAKSRF